MDFQIVNEVSSFWGTLVPPIFLGIISLFLFLWVIGKQNREVLMKRFVGNDDKEYVCQNGIYIPKNQTIKYIFVRRFLKKLGFEALKPLMIVFLTVLVFFGINQLLLQIFQPMLVYYPGRLLYSSGIDDYIIAEIWMYYPRVQSVEQLYAIIMDLTADTISSSNTFLYTVEAFIRFDILCCVLMFFRMLFGRKKSKWVNSKVILRLIVVTLLLIAILAATLFVNIQVVNSEVRNRCYIAYSMLEEKHDSITDLSWDIQHIEIENYLTIIKQEKKQYGDDLYYGAFEIKNRVAEYTTNVVREFYRFFSSQ